jgi:NhaP-type Na+/H+ or K+/H+ antiporter
MPPWSNLFILGWNDMRGIVSFAAALALPMTAAGTPFPYRVIIILIAFMVIQVTLLLQGLSLPLLICILDLGKDRSIEHEERQARKLVALAALTVLDAVVLEDWPVPDQIEQLRVHYTLRQSYADVEATNKQCTKEIAEAFKRLRYETLIAERLTVIKLRNDGVISDELLHRLEHELDVEPLRIGIGELRVSSGQLSKKP